jgi:hypothetical protein
VYHAHSPFSIQKVIKEYNIGRVEWFRHLGIQSTDPQTSKAGCTGTLAEASSTGSSTASPDAIHRIDVLIYCFLKVIKEYNIGRVEWFRHLGIQSTDPQTSKAGCTGTLAEASSTGSSTASPDAIHRIDVLIYCFLKVP